MHTCEAERRDVRMAKALQTEGMPRQGPRNQLAVAVLTALGVVYGDNRHQPALRAEAGHRGQRGAPPKR
jgi:hypothetical protein